MESISRPGISRRKFLQSSAAVAAPAAVAPRVWGNESKPMGLSISKIPQDGLPAEYVFRETQCSIEDVSGKCKIYSGIDIDVPTAADEKQTSPSDVYAATTAALKAGADGVIYSHKYSEMRLANLSHGGRAPKK